jgi:6-phosphofructokinase 1
MMKQIGVLTSGGDSPGMNPCIRAVVRMGLSHGLEVMGIKRGYDGLIDGEIDPLTARSVGGIIQKGGTILQSARCPEFKTTRGRREALRKLNEYGIEGLVVIGGDGSLTGALELHKMGFPVVGLPGTIDNDLCYTDMAIGVDTALNTVLDAIDMIKDTASSHRRAFLIETMGRESGYLALMGGIAGGAEVILIPEVPFRLEDVQRKLEEAYVRGKAHCIIVAAEGARPCTEEVATYLREREEEHGFDVRVTILGHIQRGGSPTAFERLLATRLGAAAVEVLLQGKSGVMVGLIGNKIAVTGLEKVLSSKKEVDLEFYKLAEKLER